MKKPITLVLITLCMIVLQLSGCKYTSLAPKETLFDTAGEGERNGEMHMKEKMVEQRKEHENCLLFDTFECLVWEEQDTFVVVISHDTQNADCSLVFSENGQLLKQSGITAISVNDVSGLLHLSEEDLVSQYGSFHFDSGSGRYLPSYVTDCGSILVFSFENGLVESISESRFIDGETKFYGNVTPIVVDTIDDSMIDNEPNS